MKIHENSNVYDVIVLQFILSRAYVHLRKRIEWSSVPEYRSRERDDEVKAGEGVAAEAATCSW